MVTFTNSGRKDVYISGPTKTFYAGARIPFGAAVERSGTLGRIRAVYAENTDEVIGFACSDEAEHTYDGFYEIGEPVKVALKGSRVYANIITTANTSPVLGDYLDVADATSGSPATGTGCLEESGSGANVGETRVVTTNVAQLLEDLTLTSAIYAAPSSTPTAGESTIAMTSGGTTTMGLKVGDFILIADADGTDAQVNAVTALTDTQITVKIPITTVAADVIYAIRQGEVLVI